MPDCRSRRADAAPSRHGAARRGGGIYQAQAEGVAVGRPFIGLDGGDDHQHYGADGHHPDQQEAHRDQHQQHAHQGRYQHRDLEVQRLLALLIHIGMGVLLQLPHNQRTDQTADHRQEVAEEACQMGNHGPHAGLGVGFLQPGFGRVDIHHLITPVLSSVQSIADQRGPLSPPVRPAAGRRVPRSPCAPDRAWRSARRG